ncbi:hypothetical protein BDQ12DRAFT_410572 [Crucibulum laeve]|uniref:Uncharacterized protein n=1 Tax=Crucibulum laeve TaxID=68775 RepID=A0A5C3LK04_9AGAR|nr:hypothetical protein BDQ12DRAFT_410572 [Crucibulum laeve]
MASVSTRFACLGPQMVLSTRPNNIRSGIPVRCIIEPLALRGKLFRFNSIFATICATIYGAYLDSEATNSHASRCFKGLPLPSPSRDVSRPWHDT